MEFLFFFFINENAKRTIITHDYQAVIELLTEALEIIVLYLSKDKLEINLNFLFKVVSMVN